MLLNTMAPCEEPCKEESIIGAGDSYSRPPLKTKTPLTIVKEKQT